MLLGRLAVIALASLVAIQALVPGARGFVGPEWFGPYAVGAVLALVMLVTCTVRRRPANRAPWFALAGVGVLWLLGDVAFDLSSEVGVVSRADVFFASGAVALVVAAVLFLRTRLGRPDTDTLIEGSMVAVAAGLAAWLFMIQPRWELGSVPGASRLVIAAYPALGFVALVLFVQLLLSDRRIHPSALMLTLATASTVIADAAFAVLQQTASYDPTELHALDVLWLATYGLFALAALHPRMTELTDPPAAPRPGTSTGHLHVAGAAIAAVPLLFALAVLLDLEPGAAGVAVASVLMVPLVLWRTLRLQRRLDASNAVLAGRERYYRTIATHAGDVYLVVGPDGVVADVSDAFEPITGTAPHEVVGRLLVEVLEPDDREPLDALIMTVAATPGAQDHREVRLTTRGGPLWVEARATNLLGDPTVAGVVVNLHDITGRRRAEHALELQSLRDPLTGLPNRALLRDRIGRALHRRDGSEHDVAVLFCDIDGFRTVNDGLGHAQGDALLYTIGRRIESAVRPDDTVARLGGDEFAVLMEGDAMLEADAHVVAERIREALNDPVRVNDVDVVVTVSVGITVASREGSLTPDDLLRDADTAVYAAKEAGRDQSVHYTPTMRQASLQRVELATDLRTAVDDEQLVLQYQPIHDLASRRLVGFEALARWQHPERGLLSPQRFIPVAEQTGTIVQLGAWVLRRACTTAAGWTIPGHAAPTISVNLSPRQLRDPGLIGHVRAALDDSGLDPHRLVLELTESALVAQPEVAVEQLRRIKRLGIRLAIDDFGSGHASLAYLRQFPADVLKIDRSYTGSIHAPGDVPAMVRGILDLGRTLSLDTIAEGIETSTQLDCLTAEGCAFGQGFLFAQAVDEEDVPRLLHGAS